MARQVHAVTAQEPLAVLLPLRRRLCTNQGSCCWEEEHVTCCTSDLPMTALPTLCHPSLPDGRPDGLRGLSARTQPAQRPVARVRVPAGSSSKVGAAEGPPLWRSLGARLCRDREARLSRTWRGSWMLQWSPCRALGFQLPRV